MLDTHIARKLPDLSQQNKLPVGDNVYQEIIEANVVPTHIDKKLLETSLDEFDFSARLRDVFKRNNLKTIGDILNFGYSNFFRFKNIGDKSIEELRYTIERYLLATPEDRSIEELRNTNKRYLQTGLNETRKLPDLSHQNKQPFGFGDRFYQEIIEDTGVPTHIVEKLLKTSLDEFMFSARLSNALLRHELKTIGDVLNFGWHKFYRIKNIGRKSVNELKGIIEQYVQTGVVIEKENITYKHPEIKYVSFTEEVIDNDLLATPLDEFMFSARVSNALSKKNLRTVGDVLSFGWHNIYKMKNVGKKSLNELKNTIEHYLGTIHSTEIERNTYCDNIDIDLDDSFLSIVEHILSSSLNEKQLQIIKARYGYESGKKKTLEQVGIENGITRERVRQIIVKSHKQLNHPSIKKHFQDILEHIENLLLHNKGVASVSDLSTDSLFSSSSKNQLRFLINLIADLYEERYRIIEKSFISSLNNEELKALNIAIDEAAFKCHFPLNKNDFYNEIITAIGSISKDYLSYFLFYKKHVEISNGLFLTSGRLTIPHKIKLAMKDIVSPMHFTDIAKLYKEYFSEKNIKTSDIERAIHTRIGNSKDFIIVGPGTFMLRDKFKVPDNISEIVEKCKEILRTLNNISDTRYLIEKLKQRQVDVGLLNAYSLKPILLEYRGFVRYGRFEIGIEELSDICERRSLSDLMYDILIKSGKPLHSSDIWKQISKQRGFPRYAIEQRLYKEPQFIKLAPTTYTVKENIPSYERKRETIVGFTKEWINHKGHAVSAFFVTEVLKATEEIKDLTIGLVEHVLATSPEFNKVSNGFYDLANKS